MKAGPGHSQSPLSGLGVSRMLDSPFHCFNNSTYLEVNQGLSTGQKYALLFQTARRKF